MNFHSEDTSEEMKASSAHKHEGMPSATQAYHAFTEFCRLGTAFDCVEDRHMVYFLMACLLQTHCLEKKSKTKNKQN